MHLCCPPWHTGCLTWRREQEAQAALVEGRAELAAVSAHTRRSLAAMRWKLATAVIGSRSQMSIVRLPTLANGVPSAMPVLQEARHVPFMWQPDIVGVTDFVMDCFDLLGAAPDAHDDDYLDSDSSSSAPGGWIDVIIHSFIDMVVCSTRFFNAGSSLCIQRACQPDCATHSSVETRKHGSTQVKNACMHGRFNLLAGRASCQTALD